MGAAAKRVIAAILVTAMVVLPVVSAYAMARYLDGRLPEWMGAEFVVAAFDAREAYGIPVSASLGQMVVETGYNLDSSPYTRLFVEHHNYGGAMYYGQAQACGTIEAYGYTFCAFESDAAFLDFQYNHQLTSDRYASNANVQKGCAENDWQAYITGLCEQGYAGARTQSVIESYVDAVAKVREAFPSLKAFDLIDKDTAMRLMFGAGAGSGGDAVARAESLVGKVTYVFGACDIDNLQFDCSGFVAYCLTGISSRSQDGWYAHTETYVSWPLADDPAPGDICVYSGSQYAGGGHCGIYIGGGQMIDCSNGVAIRPVDPLMTIHRYPYG